MQIDFDPTQISYSELLDAFWHGHSPYNQAWSQQYMSIIFYYNDEQKRLATESRDRLEAETGRKVYTEIVPATDFYLAEDYHQKYYLKNLHELAGEFRAIYPDIKDFTDSTATARVNGYIAGFGTPDAVREEIDSLGLSPSGVEIVRELAERGLAPACPAP